MRVVSSETGRRRIDPRLRSWRDRAGMGDGGRGRVEPRAAVDLRVREPLTRPARPLGFRVIAHDRCWIRVAFPRPRVNRLAGFLLDGAEGEKGADGDNTSFLTELTLSGVEKALAIL